MDFEGESVRDNNSRDCCGATYACTHACTHVCYLGGFISALARGILPRDERTTSMAKRKTRAALGKKIYGEVDGSCVSERRGRVGASKQESYEWTKGDEETECRRKI